MEVECGNVLAPGWVVGCWVVGHHLHTHTTSWLHLASWNLPDYQLCFESKRDPECGKNRICMVVNHKLGTLSFEFDKDPSFILDILFI